MFRQLLISEIFSKTPSDKLRHKAFDLLEKQKTVLEEIPRFQLVLILEK